MKYFTFNNINIPLSCITGLSYSRSGNIVETSALSCKCNGINPLEIQVQITLSAATCYEGNFMNLARQLSRVAPNKNDAPSFVTVGEHIIVPQLKFMLTSVNITYQSDRIGNLQEMNISWTLSGSQVVKQENRQTELKSDNMPMLPKVILHCQNESVECSQDICIANLKLSGFKGHIELVLADTYTNVSSTSWFVALIEDPNSHFEIEGYGKFYISSADFIGNWLTCDLTKFPKSYYNRVTKTLISDSKRFSLKDVFKDADVASKATFEYLKYDDTPLNLLYALQDSLGYLIGVRNDTIYLYDVPEEIPQGQATYDYMLDSDVMTFEFSKVIIRDGVNEYVAGDDDGETWYVNALCRINEPNIADKILKYIKFNQNMITLTIPWEPRINIGSLIRVNTGESVINCVCTEYDIDLITNVMTLELHYTDR